MAKVMADMGDNLRFGHFVIGFHGNDPGAGFRFLESLFQFAFGLAGAKDQNGSGIAEKGNDLVVEARQMPGVLPLAGIIGRNCLVFKTSGGRLPGTSGLPFRTGLYPPCFFPGFGQDDDKGLSMVKPKPRFRFGISAIVDRGCVVH